MIAARRGIPDAFATHSADALMRELEPDINELRRVLSNFDNDPQGALPDLESLAGRGSMQAMLQLGDAYSKWLLGADLHKAKYWYARADHLGSGRAAHFLGHTLEKQGDSVGAFEAYRRGSDRGYLPAVSQLGRSYATGKGTVRNVSKAREVWETASSRGHLFAKRDLGLLYLSGEFGLAARLRGLGLFASIMADVVVATVRGSRHGPRIDDEQISG